MIPARPIYHILSIIAELPSTVWPCRLQGQTVPELQLHTEPFLVGLKILQSHHYGQKMETYRPPENIFDVLVSDGLSGPSDEETLLGTIHNQWIDLNTVTRDILLKFETPEFRLPRMAIGEQNV